ncbi:MAG: TIGR03643 family protein [Parvibaculales bacterium]
MSPAEISEVIGLAWHDEVSFDDIEHQTGLSEKQVIALMRREMTASSFRMWRKRVTGRKTKHGKNGLTRKGGFRFKD